jgi:serine/threonine protein kinase
VVPAINCFCSSPVSLNRSLKVLDFGLVKLTEPQSTMDTEAPTKVLVHTDAGTVIGTTNYMSPEQARAQKVDARTDIWSVTGKNSPYHWRAVG